MLPEDLGHTGSGSPKIKGIRKGIWDTMTMLTIESFGSIITTSIAKHLQHVLYSIPIFRRLEGLESLEYLMPDQEIPSWHEYQGMPR